MRYRFLSKYTPWIFLALISPTIAFSQGIESQIQWQVLENEDFYVQIPEGFQVHALDLGSRGSRIKTKRTAFRCINGTVLILDFYIGDLNSIKDAAGEPEILKGTDRESVLGFEVRRGKQSIGKNFWDWQRYTSKNSIVDVRAVSFKKNDPIVRDFLGSIRVTDQKQVAAPNLPSNTDLNKANNLAAISEIPIERSGDSEIIANDLDRNIIIIFQPRLTAGTASVAGSEHNFPSGDVMAKVLYSSSGLVTKVNVLVAPTSKVIDLWNNELRKTVFIPAMKDGRFVSVIATIELKRV